MDRHSEHKQRIADFRSALYAGSLSTTRMALTGLFHPDATIHMCHPFGDLTGPGELAGAAIDPLMRALPDLERRDWIVMAGQTPEGADWLGCGGTYLGTFLRPFLDIPPTGHLAHMRFHEFFRFEDGRVAEIQAIWDIPELMMQAGAWPLAPSLGRVFHVPGPATLDGHVPGPYDEDRAQASRAHIEAMLAKMSLHPSGGGPEVMEMERFWHPRFNWYGPAGIGSARGVEGFRNWHQKPFLAAMPDRGQFEDEVFHHFFGDGNYAAVTGWPNMAQTLSAPGWLGLPPTGQKITLRSLDFWRLEDGLIRENWVLVDLLDVHSQIGINTLGRMREFNMSRPGGTVPLRGAL